jgi:hypothetical protein
MNKHLPLARANELRVAQPPGKYRRLFLPGALLMTMGAQLLASFMFIDLRFATFF